MNTVNLNITANSANELVDQITSLARHFGVSLPTAQAAIVAEVEGEKAVTEVKKEAPKAEAPKTEEKKTSKKKEEKKEAPKAETPKTEAATFTKQDIANACQKVSSEKNLDAAKAILAQFKNEKGEACRRISDVLEADYGAFVAKCEEVLA